MGGTEPIGWDEKVFTLNRVPLDIEVTQAGRDVLNGQGRGAVINVLANFRQEG